MMKTGVRASYRTAGTQPRQTACMYQPLRMPSASGAATGPKSPPPEIPKRTKEGGRPTRRGIPQNPQGDLREPRVSRSHFLQTVADMARPWGNRAASRSRQTGSRGVLNRGETMVNDEPKRKHPNSSPHPRRGQRHPSPGGERSHDSTSKRVVRHDLAALTLQDRLLCHQVHDRQP